MQLDYKHNEFSESKYPLENGLIVDGELRISGRHILIEATNPKETTFLNDEIMQKKIAYFQRRDPFHLCDWVLVCSYTKWSKKVKDSMEKLGIEVVELGIRAEEHNFPEVIHSLFHSRLYFSYRK